MRSSIPSSTFFKKEAFLACPLLCLPHRFYLLIFLKLWLAPILIYKHRSFLLLQSSYHSNNPSCHSIIFPPWFSLVSLPSYFKLYCNEHCWHQLPCASFFRVAICYVRFCGKVQSITASCEENFKVGGDNRNFGGKRNHRVFEIHGFAEKLCIENGAILKKWEPSTL